MKKTLISLFSLLSFLGLTAQTPEAMAEIEVRQVPMNVVKQMSETYPNLEVEQWYVFDELYSAKTTQEGIVHFSKFNAEGLMLEERVMKDWKDAPEQLKSGKDKTTYKYWEVTEFYEIFENGQLDHYFLVLENDKNEIKSMYFDQNGKLQSKSNSAY